MRYKPPKQDNSQLIKKAIVENQFPWEEGSDDFQFSAAVAEFGMVLRNTPHRGNASFDEALRLASSGKGVDLAGYRSEFIRLVKEADAIAKNEE